MSRCIAVINAGSSSIKFALYTDGTREAAAFRGQVAGIGSEPSLSIRDAGGGTVAARTWPGDGFDHRSAIHAILESAIELLDGTPVAAVGHRVVHGGTRFCEPVRIDDRVMGELEALCPLAPLHQPHNLAAIAAIAEGAPHIPQVACFDTAFHRGQPRAGADLRFAARAHRVRSAPLRFPRPLLRICGAAPGRAVAGPRRRPGDRRPSRQRGEPVRAPVGPQRRHHDGLHRRRRPGDGHALRIDRSRHIALSDGGARLRSPGRSRS